jgi:CubicO group peptidase (beta-lactamase class C family)
MLLILGCASGEPAPGGLLAVDTIAQRYIDETPILGLTVAVAEGGRIVHEAGYGLARRAPDAAAGPRTPFEIFSVGKVFTTVLALRLAERGLLDLDADVAQYMRDVPAPYDSVTLRQLLRHGAGIAEADLDEIEPEPRFRRPPSRDELLAWMGEARRIAAPDRIWLYNNQGFLLAGLASAEAAGAPFAGVVREQLAEPVALDRLRFCPELDGLRSAGYLVVGETTEPIVSVDFSWFGGAGSLCAPAASVARWWLAVRAGRLLEPSARAEMMTPVTLENGDARATFGYGLGVRLGEYEGHRLIGHTGDGAGGTAVLTDYPDDSLVIVVATNTSGEAVPHAAEIGAAIARHLLGIEIVDRPPVAVPNSALEGAPGFYRSPEGEFCITRSGESLHVSTDGGVPVRLEHAGDGRFRSAGSRAVEEYFPGWPDEFGWFAYRLYGFPMDVAVRAAGGCPE